MLLSQLLRLQCLPILAARKSCSVSLAVHRATPPFYHTPFSIGTTSAVVLKHVVEHETRNG